VTFKNAQALRDIALKVPDDRILVETDAPYLAPEPHRGKTNEPAFVSCTAKRIADLRGISLEAFAKLTSNNFFQLFQCASRHKA
jgi:TatD DNase family protein